MNKALAILVGIVVCLAMITPFSRWYETSLWFVLTTLAAVGNLLAAMAWITLRDGGMSIFFLRNTVRRSSGSLEIGRTDDDPESKIGATTLLSYGGFDSPLGISVPDKSLAKVPSASVEIIEPGKSVLVYSETVKLVDARSLRGLAAQAANIGEDTAVSAFDTKRKSISEGRIGFYNILQSPINERMQSELSRLVHSKSSLVDLVEDSEIGAAAARRQVERLIAAAVKKPGIKEAAKQFILGSREKRAAEESDKPSQLGPGGQP